MFLSEQAYDDILHYAINLIKGVDYSFTAEDIANEVFLKVAESGDLSESEVKKIAYGIFKNEFRSDKGTLSYNDTYTQVSKNTFESDYSCTCCKESKSASAFYLKLDIKTGYQSISGNCRICQRKRSALYYLENKTKCAAYQKEWQRSNKTNCANKCKRYWSEQVDSLSDVYIKWYLRNYKNTPEEVILSLPNLITETRKKIFDARKGKKRARNAAPVMVAVLKNDKEISRFNSLRQAAIFLGNPNHSKRIGETLAGMRKEYMGFTFHKLTSA